MARFFIAYGEYQRYEYNRCTANAESANQRDCAIFHEELLMSLLLFFSPLCELLIQITIVQYIDGNLLRVTLAFHPRDNQMSQNSLR